MEEKTPANQQGSNEGEKKASNGIQRLVAKVKGKFTKPKRGVISPERTGETLTVEELWNTVGFHRATGGVFYSYILLIGGAVVGLATVGLIAIFLPYPEIEGYKGIVTGTLLGFWFGLLDINLGGGGGLSDSMMRLIGQYSDTNPRKAMEYIKFYIWWQMITGLGQVTGIALITFYFLEQTNFAYLGWMVLAQSVVQYPGMLMIMEDTLKAFQRGDKSAWLSWLQQTVFQVTINIVFLIFGKWWGDSDPSIGELMGIAIWYLLSQFMDDYINLAVGAKMFSTVMNERGIHHGFMQLFIPKFDRAVIIQCIKFIGPQWILNQALGIIGYFVGIYIVLRTPSFASWSGLLLIPNFLGHLVSMINWGSPTVPAVAESYNNGKPELAKYFIHDMFKYWIFTVIFMATPLIVLSTKIIDVVLNSGILGGNLANYRAGLVMTPVVMIFAASGQWRSWWSRLFVACNKPLPPVWLNYAFTPSGYVLQFLFLYWCVDTPTLPVWMLVLGMPGFINNVAQTIVGYIWFQRSILKIGYKQMFWQCAMAPILTAACYAGVLVLFQLFLWPPLEALFVIIAGAQWGPFVLAFLVLMMILFLFPSVFMCPFYSFWGGWDEFTLEEFRKCMLISGPSKGLMNMMYKISLWVAKRSPLHNKFPLANYELVTKQLQELIDEGRATKLMRRGK